MKRKMDPESIIKRRLKESHERQFNGEDYQAVAIDLTDDIDDNIREEVFNELSTTPDPYCDCGFCEKAPWRDY